MAKYTVDHKCGHSREVQLAGKHDERDRKLEWMASQDCPQCWGAAQREIESRMAITASVGLAVDTNEAGAQLIEIVLTGGTRNRRESIKALGYSWGEVRGGIMGMLSASRPQQAWIKCVRLDLLPAALLDLAGVADKVDNKLSVLDIEYLRGSEAKRAAARQATAEAEAKAAAILKPVRPECHPREAHKGGAWNGKYYGRPGSYNYYISGERYTLTDAEHGECMAYREAHEDYTKAVEAAKKGAAA